MSMTRSHGVIAFAYAG